MSSRPRPNGSLSLRVRAEAAAWLAGLRGSKRTSDLDGRFKRWLATSDANRAAWERQSEAWELAGGLRSRFESAWAGRAARARAARERSQPRMLFAVIAVLSAALVALILARFVSTESGTVATASGEQRTVVLADGSRVTLNTDTRIAVRYDDRTRRVRLDRGEALFDVRPEHDRPFVVVAGRREVRALGTAFDVRREVTGKLAVTLIQGRVSIVPAAGWSRPIVANVGRLPDATVLASPGERATFTPDERPALDHPPLRQVIAWQSGQVVFNHTPLPEAVREMNRYSDRRIVLEGSDMESLHVGGLFQAGESTAFARAIAETFGLGMHAERDRIVLSRSNGTSPPRVPRRGSSSRH